MNPKQVANVLILPTIVLVGGLMYVLGARSVQAPQAEVQPESQAVEANQVNTTSETINYKNDRGLDITNGRIFFDGVERGWVTDERIYLKLADVVYSFAYENGVEVLDFHRMQGFENIVFYDGVRMNLPAQAEALYDCDQAIVTASQKIADCETNGVDSRSQYEFGAAHKQFSTGGGYSLSWRHIVVNKIAEKDIIFETDINSAFIDIIPGFIPLEALAVYKSLLEYGLVEDLELNLNLINREYSADEAEYEKIKTALEPLYLEMRDMLQSSAYLEALKANQATLATQEMAKKLIESFKIEEAV